MIQRSPHVWCRGIRKKGEPDGGAGLAERARRPRLERPWFRLDGNAILQRERASVTVLAQAPSNPDDLNPTDLATVSTWVFPGAVLRLPSRNATGWWERAAHLQRGVPCRPTRFNSFRLRWDRSRAPQQSRAILIEYLVDQSLIPAGLVDRGPSRKVRPERSKISAISQFQKWWRIPSVSATTF